MEEIALNENDQTEDHSNNKFLQYLGITVDYLSIPLCITAVVFNIFLIFVTLKHKRLRTRHNFYLVNFAIFHSIYIISTPTLHIIVDAFYNGDIYTKIYCVFLKIENYAILVMLIFTAGYTLDAILEKRQDKCYYLYERFYKYMFMAIQIFGVVSYAIAAGLCYVSASETFSFYLLTSFFFLIAGALSYAHWINERKTIFVNATNPLKISLPIIICYLPLIICYSLLHIFKNNHKIEFFLWYSAFLPEFLAYCCSLVVVYKLYHLDKHFRVAFRKLFRRPVQNADYDELNSPDDVEVK